MKNKSNQNWKILIVDDDEDVLKISNIILKDINYDNIPIKLLFAKTLNQAKEVFIKNNDIVAIMLDIVLDNDNDGFLFTKYIRETLKNKIVRIIIRTGYLEQEPIQTVFEKYDISNYKQKNELTSQSLKTEIFSAINNYKSIIETINKNDPKFYEQKEKTIKFKTFTFNFKYFIKKFQNNFLFNTFEINNNKIGFFFIDIGQNNSINNNIIPEINIFFKNELINYKNNINNQILNPKKTLTHLNQLIYNNKIKPTIFKIVYAIIDAQNNKLIFTNAGQFPRPIVICKKEQYITNNKTLPIGIDDELNLKNETIEDISHKTIAIISNAITDKISETNNSLFNNKLLNYISNYTKTNKGLNNFDMEKITRNIAILTIEAN